MRPPHVVLAIFSVLLLLGTVVPAGSAAPPPEGVCGICGSEFERTAQKNGIDATVSESSLTVNVAADGMSYWEATATLNRDATKQLSENRTLLTRTVNQSYSSYRTVVDDPENLTVTLNDRTLSVTYTVADATHLYPGDVLVFDTFVRHPPHGEAYVNTDRLRVTGPSSTIVTYTPEGSTVEGNQAVWTSSPDRGTYSPRLGRDATIAFAPDGGIVAQAATTTAVRAHVLGMIKSELLDFALIPAVLVGLLGAGLLFARDRLPQSLTNGRRVVRWLAVGTGMYAGLTALAFVIGGDNLWLPLVIVGIGLAPQVFLTASVALLAGFLDVDTGRNLPRIAMVTVLVWTLALLLGAPSSALLVTIAGPLIFLPFGFLAGARNPARFFLPLVAALGPVVEALPLVPRVGVVFVSPMMLAMVSLGTALLGIPLFTIGHRLSEIRDPSIERKPR